MKGMKTIALALSVAALAGCKDSVDNEGNTPTINTPGRTDVTVQVAFPPTHLAIQGLDTVTNYTILSSFVAFGFDFTNPDHLLQYFIPGGAGAITSNVQKDALMIVEAFDPATKDMLGAVVGFNNADLPDPIVVNINAMTDSIADLIEGAKPDREGGLADDIQELNITDVFDVASISQLVVEGTSTTDANASTQGDRDAALDRLMAAATPGLASAEEYVQIHLNGTTWNSDSSDMSVTFNGGNLTYTDPSSNVEAGTYTLRRASGVTYIDLVIDNNGTSNVVFDGVIGGGDAFTLMGQNLVKQ